MHQKGKNKNNQTTQRFYLGRPSSGLFRANKKSYGIVKINKEILKNLSAIILMTLEAKINSRIEQK